MRCEVKNVKRYLLLSVLLVLCLPASGQVDYRNKPWRLRADSGPDKEVPGWYYNLGITGIRVELIADKPKFLLVKYVFKGSPADRKVKVGDVIIGVNNRPFQTEHKNGYGMKVFGGDGPIKEFANALEACQREKKKGKLTINVLRKRKKQKIKIKVENRYGTYGKTFPMNCKKSSVILKQTYAYLLKEQKSDGSWTGFETNLFAPLALMSSGDKKHREAIKKSAKYHARNTKANDSGSLINWRYMSAAIVLSEYYLQSKEKWVIKELKEIYTFLLSTQYTNLSQVNPKVKESHPDSYPKNKAKSHGGWGHNPGFEGYGPIAMITAQGALAFSLMEKCGITIDRNRHDIAYAYLDRATGPTGYVWYEDSYKKITRRDWADMGRTGTTAIAFALSPYRGNKYKRSAALSASCIGQHPQSFPDTHGSPLMGMGFTALGAHIDRDAFRRLMDANKWWFTLAQCFDGTFYYQPNRDNARYGGLSRIAQTAIVAFIYSLKNKKIQMSRVTMGSKKR
jgi:hypothetical protein